MTCKLSLSRFLVSKILSRIVNNSYTRTSTILRAATSTFSTEELKQDVKAFEEKIKAAGKMPQFLEGTFKGIYGELF